MAGRDLSGTVFVKTDRHVGYRLLAAVTGLAMAAAGGMLIATFFSNVMLPHGMQIAFGPLETNYWGYYMTGFAGVLLLVWASFLASAAWAPLAGRTVGTVTAFGLAANSVFRGVAWFSGEYAEIGNVPRLEAAVMLLLAIAFLWLRPRETAGRMLWR